MGKRGRQGEERRGRVADARPRTKDREPIPVGLGAGARLLDRLGATDGLPADGEPLVARTEGVPVKAWVKGVVLEAEARHQIEQVACMPYVSHWIAVMPDAHSGRGACVGTVICNRAEVRESDPEGAVAGIAPASVGVDIGCGMMACRLDLDPDRLPAELRPKLRGAIERAVPHGRTDNGGDQDEGAWRRGAVPARVEDAWRRLRSEYEAICEGHHGLVHRMAERQLGTMGTGNHFLEVDRDETGGLWVMLHSGSRGPGNKVGSHFTALARKRTRQRGFAPVSADLAWLEVGEDDYDDYVGAVAWAQRYAWSSRELMMAAAVEAIGRTLRTGISVRDTVHVHHNYVAEEEHQGERVLITRKGAIRAAAGDRGIIPGSMGARSFIVEGLGNPESFCSASHGAGRTMSRGEAMRRITMADHTAAMRGIEARLDLAVLDESPAAYKDIACVMAAQRDLVRPIHTLGQLIVIKG